MQEEETTTKGERCDLCKYYIFIDSGYGYCRRYPPRFHPKKTFTIQGLRTKFEILYPIVEWCRRACGEYIIKNE